MPVPRANVVLFISCLQMQPYQMSMFSANYYVRTLEYDKFKLYYYYISVAVGVTHTVTLTVTVTDSD